MKSLGVDEIHYQRLIQILSHKPYYPLSLHLRNHLLAAYSAQHNPPDASKQDPWTTYKEYRKGVQVVAVGDVPDGVQTQRAERASLEKRAGLWGIAILFPANTSFDQEANQDVDEEETGHIWHDMRLLLWLSSETGSETEKVSMESIKGATKEEESLLHHLLHDFLPKAAQRLCLERKIAFNCSEAYSVDLFAVNDAWVQVMQRWTQDGDPTIKLTRANPCMTFVKSEAESLIEFDVPSHWRINEFMTREEVTLVQTANSLRYPRWYLEQRKHISMLIRDGEGKDSNEYPVVMQQGSPAAWAYAHDDLSLASLHVAEPYRRSGLGKACVYLMGKKLMQAQKRALVQAGYSTDDADIATPFLLDTEMHKGASRLFFEAQGFQGIVVATWGTIAVTSP